MTQLSIAPFSVLTPTVGVNAAPPDALPVDVNAFGALFGDFSLQHSPSVAVAMGQAPAAKALPVELTDTTNTAEIALSSLPPDMVMPALPITSEQSLVESAPAGTTADTTLLNTGTEATIIPTIGMLTSAIQPVSEVHSAAVQSSTFSMNVGIDSSLSARSGVASEVGALQTAMSLAPTPSKPSATEAPTLPILPVRTESTAPSTVVSAPALLSSDGIIPSQASTSSIRTDTSQQMAPLVLPEPMTSVSVSPTVSTSVSSLQPSSMDTSSVMPVVTRVSNTTSGQSSPVDAGVQKPSSLSQPTVVSDSTPMQRLSADIANMQVKIVAKAVVGDQTQVINNVVPANSSAVAMEATRATANTVLPVADSIVSAIVSQQANGLGLPAVVSADMHKANLPIEPSLAANVRQVVVNHVQPVDSASTSALTQTSSPGLLSEDKVVDLLGDHPAIMFTLGSTSAVSSSVLVSSGVSGLSSDHTSSTMSNGVASGMSALLMSANTSSGQQQSMDQGKQQGDLFLGHGAQLSERTTQTQDDNHAFATLLSTSTPTPLTNSPLISPALVAPLSLRHPQWTQEMGSRMQMMVSQKVDEVELRIDPLDLGPMKINLKMDSSQKAHVTLSAQHGLTRDMLENALPRLRELLAQEGIDLGSANVDTGSYQQSSDHTGQQAAYNDASEFNEEAANHSNIPKPRVDPERIVDQFA